MNKKGRWVGDQTLSCAVLHCLDHWSFVVGSLKLGHVGSPTLALLFQQVGATLELQCAGFSLL